MRVNPPPKGANIRASVRILASSDVHMHLTGWDARSDRVLLARGFNRLATVIQTARIAAPGVCVLLDNGDSIQGTPTADLAAAGAVEGTHAWADCLNALKYDAVGLGNHDFDYGLDQMCKVFGDAQAPTLCANLGGAQIDGIAPYAILTRDAVCTDGQTRALRIGVTSVLPSQTMMWNDRVLEGRVSFGNAIEAAQHAVAELRAQDVDLVIMLAHSGLDPNATAKDENFGMVLAQHVTGIDAFVFGHVHLRFPDQNRGCGPQVDPVAGTIHGVPSVMPGFAAECLGQIDLDLMFTDAGWDVARHDVALIPAEDAVPDTTVTQIAAPFIHATRARMNTTVGETGHSFHSYFSMLHSSSAEALLADTMRDVIRTAIVGTEFANLPVLASVAPSAAGGYGGPTNFVHVSRGVFRERHVSMLCLYQNDIWATVMTGAQMRAYCEHAAAFFGPPGLGVVPLVSPEAPIFNFDALHGLETEIDPYGLDEMGMARRIKALRHNGTIVEDTAKFVVAMTSFRASGGGGFPGVGPEGQIIRTQHALSDTLRKKVAAQPISAVRAPSAWRFADNIDAQVLIETSPEALKYLDEIAAFSPEPLGCNAAGFMEVRVSL